MARHKRVFATANDSLSIQRLCQEADNRGFSTSILWKILCVTNADPDLIAFPTNCSNLIEMIEQMDKTWGPQMDPSDTWLRELQTEWLPVLRWVVAARETLQALMPRAVFDVRYEDRPSAEHVNPNYNAGVARHPVHAMLWCSYPKDDPLHSSYRLAQAHLFAAILVSFHNLYDSPEKLVTAISAYRDHGGEHEWLGLPNSPAKACLMIRRLRSEHEGYPDYLRRLQVSLPPREFARSLRTIEPPDIRWVIQRHKDFRLFLEKAFGLRNIISRRNIQRGSYEHFDHFMEPREIAEGSIRRELDLADPDDPYLSSASPSRISLCRKRTKDEIKETLNLDDDPWEEEDDASDDEFYVPPEVDVKSPPSHSIPSWSQQQPILMANQLMPQSYRTLSQSEARTIVCFAEQWLQEHQRDSLKAREVEQLKALTFLLTSLSIGVVTNCGLRIHVYSAGGERPGPDAQICLRLAADATECAEWRIAVVHLPYLSHPDVQDATQRRRSDYLTLPDVLGVSRFIERLRQAKQKRRGNPVDGDISRKRAWRFTCTDISEQRKILSIIDPSSRITNAKIAGYLFSRLMITTGGDITAAAIVAGEKLPLARTRLFYACTRLRRIQECYVNALEGLLPTGIVDAQRIRWDANETWIATRPCPTTQAVRGAVQSLQERIGQLRPYLAVPEYVEYHNLYTLYTLWHCAYATSLRPIRSPLFLPRAIECEPDGDGIAWINDKDVGAGYNARLAWIPAAVAKQIQYYAEHLSAVSGELLFRHGDGGVRNPALLAQSCFFLDAYIQPIEVRKSSLEHVMHEVHGGLQFPVNIHRRFVSAELLDRGVSSEAVDWWMGHWHLGEEPWSKYSSLCFAEYRTQLQPLVDLLAELGFRARRSAIARQGRA